MLSEKECSLWYRQVGFSDLACELINEIRSSDPARLVHGGGLSVVGLYPSRKMGRTLQFDSHRCELAFIQSTERDNNVLEIWDQPKKIKLTYKSKSGRMATVPYVPDFFVCRKDGAGFIECKTEDNLIVLAEDQPGRYCRGEDGEWHSPPVEEYTQKFGLGYTIKTTAHINPVYIRNIEFLDDYFRKAKLSIVDDVRQYILSIVSNHPGIQLSELLSLILAEETTKIDADDVYSLIIRGDIYTDLYLEPLAERERVRVFENKELADMYLPTVSAYKVPRAEYFDISEGTRLTWDNKVWEIVNIGEQKIWLQGQAKVISLAPDQFESYINHGVFNLIESSSKTNTFSSGLDYLDNTQPNARLEADRRLELIKPYLNKEKKLLGIKGERTLRRYISNFREAEILYGIGLVGLIPNWNAEGKSVKRLLEEVYQIMDERITTDYESLEQKNAWVVYGKVLNDCEERGISKVDQPSYPTFCKRINTRPRAEQTRKRKGKRAAYQHETHIYWLDKDTPPHGDRPFHIAHADSTKINLELVCPITGENLGRAWASFLIDAYTRVLLAMIITYDPPSYRTTMMLLRECARRHKRLPQILVVDRGKEFDNTYLRRLAGIFEMTVKFRPAAKPRHGSVSERLFGISEDEFIHNLMGNTQIMTEVRKVTKSINPRNLAVWTLGAFNEWFTAWGYEYYNKRIHWTLKQIPIEAFARSIELTGSRRKLIVYDETFRVLTMPTTRKQTAKNVVDKGVKINGIYYWNNALRERAIEGKQLYVRYDPFRISIAYVRIRGKWIRCTSEHYATFERCTERQLHIISSELRKRHRKLLCARPITAKALGDFITKAEKVQGDLATRRLLLQRIHDRETKSVFKIINNEPGDQSTISNNSQDCATSQYQSVKGIQEPSPFGAIDYTRLKVLGELK
jgi:putative transposase